MSFAFSFPAQAAPLAAVLGPFETLEECEFYGSTNYDYVRWWCVLGEASSAGHKTWALLIQDNS
ncbi:MAG: hypothetical protein J7647_17435 [Cyanobacteria bacterium SBLK]|nr:hypothetical protein [Cyanobacteria bacterium SBLK]